MTTGWRSVALLAEELGLTETQTYKELHRLGVRTFSERYHVLSYVSTKGEGKRGPSLSSGFGAMYAVLRHHGIEIRQHQPNNYLLIEKGGRRATIRVYQSHGAMSFHGKRGFLDDRNPMYYLFITSPANIAWVFKRDDLIKYFKNKTKPDYVNVPEGWEEHHTGCLTFKFTGGEPEQLKSASQLGL